jgi:hypothetical protein
VLPYGRDAHVLRWRNLLQSVRRLHRFDGLPESRGCSKTQEHAPHVGIPVKVLRFIFDFAVEVVKGIREDWPEVKREIRDDVRTITRGTPE